MSFDVLYMPCRFGSAKIERKNEYTGKIESVLPNDTLTAAEFKAVRDVLNGATIHGPDEFGCHVVRAKDGGETEVFARNLDQKCMVALRGISPGLLEFLFDLLRAGNWCMIPPTEENFAIVSSLAAVRSVPDDFPKIVICNSAEELGSLLSGDLSAWKKYRDQVVGG
jgi:hypothetical protein